MPKFVALYQKQVQAISHSTEKLYKWKTNLTTSANALFTMAV